MSKEYIDFELQMAEDVEILVKDCICGGGGGGIYVFSSAEEMPAIGNKSYLYIVRDYGTFYWDILENKYKPIPLYEEIIEKIWITADNYQFLTADNKIFKPIM